MLSVHAYPLGHDSEAEQADLSSTGTCKVGAGIGHLSVTTSAMMEYGGPLDLQVKVFKQALFGMWGTEELRSERQEMLEPSKGTRQGPLRGNQGQQEIGACITMEKNRRNGTT